MSLAGPQPHFSSALARRAFSSEHALRRFAKVAQLRPEARVLEVAGGNPAATLFLARELRCSVLALELNDAQVAVARDKVNALGLAARVEVRKLEPGGLAQVGGGFDAVLVHAPVGLVGAALVRAARALLARNGRLGFVHPVRVGRLADAPVLAGWRVRLGEPLLLPRELLQLLEREGYEPEAAESLSDGELDGLLTELEPTALADASLAEAVAVHREQGGRASVSYAFAVGRRREPGEKPAASNDRG